MTAVAHRLPAGRGPVRALWPCPPGFAPAHRPGARPTAAQFRRRRAAVSLAAAVLLGGVVALGVPGGVPLTPSGPAPAGVPVASTSYVVRPGDTLWQIARAYQSAGDVRPLVQRLAAARGGAPLRAGERMVVPPG